MIPSEFDDLMEHVEAAGGQLLPDPCEGELIEYVVPAPAPAGRATIEVRTCHCGEHARVAVPYDPGTGGAGAVTLCVICDGPEGRPMPLPSPGRDKR